MTPTKRLLKIQEQPLRGKPAPLIRLHAAWLRDYGFCGGGTISVEAEKNQIVIRKEK